VRNYLYSKKSREIVTAQAIVVNFFLRNVDFENEPEKPLLIGCAAVFHRPSGRKIYYIIEKTRFRQWKMHITK
jgi:hypothetical protein